MLEFLRSTVPVFEEFLTVLQRSGPTKHVVYDAMRLTLLKLMRRFVQADQLKDVHGSAPYNLSHAKVSRIDFPMVNLLQVIIQEAFGTAEARQTENNTPWHACILGAAVSHLQAKLPLNNRVLKDLGCLNPLKRERKSTTISIRNLSRKLLQEFDTAAVLDERKLYQNNGDTSDIDTDQRVDHY